METLIQRILDGGGLPGAERPAISFKTEIVACRAFKERMVNIGTHLCTPGVKPGSRVLFFAGSRPEATACLGVQYAGTAAVPVDKNAAADVLHWVDEREETPV